MKAAERAPQPSFHPGRPPVSDGPAPGGGAGPLPRCCVLENSLPQERQEGSSTRSALATKGCREDFILQRRGKDYQPAVPLDAVGSDLKADRREATFPRTLPTAHYVKYRRPASKRSSPTCFSKISIQTERKQRGLFAPICCSCQLQ